MADVEPLRDVIVKVILGAGSVAAMWWMVESNDNALAPTDVGVESHCAGLLRHTLAKWPILPQVLQDRLKAGHRGLPPGCGLPPHPGQA